MIKLLITIGLMSPLFANHILGKTSLEEAEKKIKYLKADAFPELPADLKKQLDERKCQIPQTNATSVPQNVIQGSFAAPKSKDWAVLCAKNGKTSILVFWEKGTPCPAELAIAETKADLQDLMGKGFRYSRYISMVAKEHILEQQKRYGGILPKSLDHQGIDDAFLEKASVTYYCEAGKWLRLTGSD